MASPRIKITLDTTTQPNAECSPLAQIPEEFVGAACIECFKRAKVIRNSRANADPQETLGHIGTRNGLIETISEAYKNHRHLVLHPDHFIIAALLQLANKRWMNEGTRGQEEAGIKIHTREKVGPEDYEAVRQMIIKDVTGGSLDQNSGTNEIIKCVLKGNMVPSDTKEAIPDQWANDSLWGGSIPSVTLLGEKTDWEKMFKDFKSLKEDLNLTAYISALDRLSDYYVKSFKDPKDAEVILFWKKMCPTWGQKGWLAVFNTWDTTDAEMGLSYPLKVGGSDGPFLDTYADPIKENCVSLGYRKLNSIFDYREGLDFKGCVTFAAGNIGTQFWSDPDGYGIIDTVQPLSAWVIFLWHEGK